jgi:hypothetical protein
VIASWYRAREIATPHQFRHVIALGSVGGKRLPRYFSAEVLVSEHPGVEVPQLCEQVTRGVEKTRHTKVFINQIAFYVWSELLYVVMQLLSPR